jgi:hypothetical protein
MDIGDILTISMAIPLAILILYPYKYGYSITTIDSHCYKGIYIYMDIGDIP